MDENSSESTSRNTILKSVHWVLLGLLALFLSSLYLFVQFPAVVLLWGPCVLGLAIFLLTRF